MECLWSEDELYYMGYGKKTISPLPMANMHLLDQVLLLLLTVNENEDNAALCYLEPLPGHTEIYRYMQRDDAAAITRYGIYLIGQYGACSAAVRRIKPGSGIGGATTAPDLACRCFKKLNAIIGLGVACGVENKVGICDVLIADKVNNYDQARLQKGGTLNRGFAIPTSDLLSSIFRQNMNWLDDDIKQRLGKSDILRPKIKQGIILSGPYLLDNEKVTKDLIQSFAAEAIGIEMEAAYLFNGVLNTTIHMTIVKAVSDFGDGQKDKRFQPTAALLAAHCVKRYLDDQQVVNMLCRDPGDVSVVSPMLNLSITNQGQPAPLNPATSIVLTDKPTLSSLLHYFKDVDNWKNLALQLIPADYQFCIKDIEINHRGNIEQCRWELATEYLKAGEVSWRKLIDAFKKSGFENIASQVEKDVSNMTTRS